MLISKLHFTAGYLTRFRCCRGANAAWFVPKLLLKINSDSPLLLNHLRLDPSETKIKCSIKKNLKY